jgi:hypothetical protein
MSYRGALNTPNALYIIGFRLEMQKIWPMEILSLIIPKKTITKHIFYLCSSNGNPINEHLCTNTCHKSTLSPNNLMLKLIMFVEKTKRLYSKVEIKTLKQGKTMFSYQTLEVC